MTRKTHIGIAQRISHSKWNDKFEQALQRKLKQGYQFSYAQVNLDQNDWLKKIKPFDIIIWKSPWMGHLTLHYKEKIFFIGTHLQKKTLPNFETIWHFDSKIAQHFIFDHYNINSPFTFVSFDYNEAIEYINTCTYPQILKLSAGSGSNHVKMINNVKQAKKEVQKHFTTNILWKQVENLTDHQVFGSIYFQEFIPNNSADLRITTIGDKYAFGFWRENRENDFKASGSGKIDYTRDVPEEALHYCLDISKKLQFDSMAYDLLFQNNTLKISEMSYGYNQHAIHKTPGHYKRTDNNSFIYESGHYWPQDLWVEWLFEKYKI